VRIGIQQRALPHYRVSLYDAIAERCSDRVEVFAGYPEPAEGVVRAESLSHAGWRRIGNVCVGVGRQKAYWQPGFVRWLENFCPDVLLAESNPRILSNYHGFRYARRRRISVIGWGVGVRGNARDQGPYGMFMRRYFRQFDGMIAYGTKGAEDFEHLGVDPKRVFIARNSVSTTQIDQVLENPVGAEDLVQRFRTCYQINGKRVVLFLGRMVSEKQVDFLLEAVGNLRQEYHLLLVGDGPLRSDLEREARKHNLVATFTGHLKGRDLISAILTSNLCVLPGQGGLAIQEVMAAGVPVIAGVADGTQHDLIKQGITGFHFGGDTASELAELIKDCLSDLHRLKEIGKAARELVQHQHNLDRAVESVFTAIQSIQHNESSGA